MASSGLRALHVQLDYHFSAQFAGLLVAQNARLYEKHRVLCHFYGPPVGGEEPEVVLQRQRALDLAGDGGISIGSVEQNVLFPSLARGNDVKAFATIMASTPLSLAARPGEPLSGIESLRGKTVGVHIDSHELMASLLSQGAALGGAAEPTAGDPSSIGGIDLRVVAREEKHELLAAGEVDAIQVYECTEAVELERRFGEKAPLLPFGALAGDVDLGYGQALFAPRRALRLPGADGLLRSFLAATREGWALARSDPRRAEELCLPFLEGEQRECFAEHLRLLLPFVSPDLSIDPSRWHAVNEGFVAMGYAPARARVDGYDSLDASIARESASAHVTDGVAPDGLAIARHLRSEAAQRASAAALRLGRPPALAVVSVGMALDGEGVCAGEAERARLQSFSTEEDSWFSKRVVVEKCGIRYEAHNLDGSATPADVHAAVAHLNAREDVDAVLLERPLRFDDAEIDAFAVADAVGATICPTKDVDGELCTHASLPLSRGGDPSALLAASAWHASAASRAPVRRGVALPMPWAPHEGLGAQGALPCTVGGALVVLDSLRAPGGGAIDLRGMDVTVIGRSRKLGLPLALALLKRDANVCVLHSATRGEQLRESCRRADLIVAAAGVPGLVTADMVKEGALVLNIGTTHHRAGGEHALLPDVAPEVAAVASVVTPTPHGIGPTCVAMLCVNTVALAEDAARAALLRHRHRVAAPPPEPLEGDPPPAWDRRRCGETHAEVLRREVVCRDFDGAVALLERLRDLAGARNHHPVVTLNAPRVCEETGAGCPVRIELSTFAEGKITERDARMAEDINELVACIGVADA